LRDNKGFPRLSQSRQLDGLILLVLLTLCYWVVDAAVGLYAPIPNDHTVHLAKLATLKNQIATEHRWWGWTHDILFGYPLNYTYPSLGYLLILALEVGSGPLLSLDAAYMVFLHLLASFVVITVYALGQRIGGRCAGFVAALFTIYDEGSSHYGGALWYDGVGVWACQLSLAFHLVFLYLLLQMMEAKTLSKASLAGLCLGLSLLAHPISGVASVIAVAAWLLCLMSTRAVKKADLGRLFERTTVMAVTGFFLSAVWILPYLSVKDYTLPFPKQWLSLEDILQAMAISNFAAMSPALSILGLLGGAYCLSQARTEMRIIPVYALLLILFGSTTFQQATGLVSIFKEFELIRLAIFLRPLFAIAAGVLVSLIANKAYPGCFESNGHRRADFRWTRSVKTVLGQPTLLLSGAIVACLMVSLHRFTLPRLAYHWDQKKPSYTLDVRDQLLTKLDSLSRNEEGFFRIHISQPELEPSTFMDFSRKLGVPVSFDAFYPVTNVRYGNARGQSRADISRYGVRFYVTETPMPRNEVWSLVAQVGPWWVYRINDIAHADCVRVVRGSGQIQDLNISANAITFSASAESPGEIGVYVSPFPRWRLTIDGQPRTWTKLEEPGYPDSAMILPLESGEYRLVFETSWPEWLGLVLSLWGFILVIACLGRPHVPGFEALAKGLAKRSQEPSEPKLNLEVPGQDSNGE